MVRRNIILLCAAAFLFACAGAQPKVGELLEGAERTGASKKVSELPELAVAPAESDVLFIDDSGVSRQITVINLMKALEAALTSFEVANDNLPSNNAKIVGLTIYDGSAAVETDAEGNVFFRIPATINGWDLIDIEGTHYTAGTGTGSEVTTIQLHNVTTGNDILSTALTIDEDETDSSTADTQAAINTTYDSAATGEKWRIDVDGVTSGAPYGLYIELTFQEP